MVINRGRTSHRRSIRLNNSTYRAGAGNPSGDEADDETIVRSRDQKPNKNQTDTQSAMEPDSDPEGKRNTM